MQGLWVPHLESQCSGGHSAEQDSPVGQPLPGSADSETSGPGLGVALMLPGSLRQPAVAACLEVLPLTGLTAGAGGAERSFPAPQLSSTSQVPHPHPSLPREPVIPHPHKRS